MTDMLKMRIKSRMSGGLMKESEMTHFLQMRRKKGISEGWMEERKITDTLKMRMMNRDEFRVNK